MAWTYLMEANVATEKPNIEKVDGRQCWGVRLVCAIQLNAASRRHECLREGRCIFAPKPPAKHGVAACPATEEWNEASRIRDLPEVDEAIRNMLEDQTGDNSTCMVREVLRATRGVDLPDGGQR